MDSAPWTGFPILPQFSRWATIRPHFLQPADRSAPFVEYHFRPLGKTCAATGNPLQPGTVVQSVLFERHGQFERLDFSVAGWTGMPGGALARWRCRVPEPVRQSQAPLDPESLLSYFEQLVEDANPAHDKLRYVLALFLLQRRRLKLDGSRHDGERDLLQVSGSRGEGPYEIVDQQLAEAEIRQLQGEIAQLMNTEWKAA